MRYACVENGTIINIVEADEAFAAEHQLVDLSANNPEPGIGWKFESGVWTEPVYVAPESSLDVLRASIGRATSVQEMQSALLEVLELISPTSG